MPISCNLAPFINIPFYVTGEYGEPRPDHTHKGVDLSTGLISNVCSMTNGIVTHSASGMGYGEYVIIKENGTGMSFLYGDLQNRQVSVGDSVSLGTIIGKEGSPAGATGYHVHVEQQDTSTHNWYFTTYESGYYINPCLIMGVQNVESYTTSYIYNGTPPTPPPSPKSTKKFPWVVYARKLRNIHNI